MMDYIDECLKNAEIAMENAMTYEKQFNKTMIAPHVGYYSSAANYYISRAIFHQNNAIIELLKNKK